MNLVLQKNQIDNVKTSCIFNNKESASFPAKAGDFITAVITDKTSKKTSLQTVDYDGYAFQADAGSVKGEIGQEVSFQVLKNDKDGLVLKQVTAQLETTKTAKAGIKQQALADIKELLKQNHIIKEENVFKPEERVEEQIKTMNAIAKIRRQLSYPAANASLNAVNELVASGLSLSKISLPLLNSVMKEIESKPVKEISSEELSRLVDDYFNKSEDANKKGHKQEQDIIRTLASHGLPSTSSNVEALNKVLRQASEAGGLEENVIASLIQKETPLTLEALYIGKYSANGPSEKEGVSDEVWQALLPEIHKTFRQENVKDTAENLKAARFLVENQCPVTRENIQKLSFLQHLEERLDRQELLSAAAQNIKQDKPVTDILLYGQESNLSNLPSDKLYENYCGIIEILPCITAGDAANWISHGHTITLDAIRNRYLSGSANPATPAEPTPDAIAAKRQLTEIAVKLTHEAAYRLSQKNIRIDTVPLSDALESLKNLEHEGYEKNLRSMGVDSHDGTMAEKRTLMADLYEKLAIFKPEFISGRYSQGVSGEILSQRVGFTINGVHAYLREAYDRQQAPNPQYGDSFQKVKEQFASFLERMKVTASTENVRAAAILSRNELDVTEENITKIKNIDYKVNRLADSLHPNIAANMIKEGYNPVEMRIDDILDYIKGFEQIYGNSLGDKLTEHILKLDESHDIDQNVRKPMIAIYRMLNLIEKNEGAALGVVLRDKANPTLGDLMEASKSYTKAKKGKQLDYTIGDDFGGLSRLVKPETNIRSLLENRVTPESDANKEYQRQLLNDIGELAMPDILQNLLKQPNFYDRTLEDLVQELKELSQNEQMEQPAKEEADFYVRQLQSLSAVSPNLLQTLTSYQIPPTLGNILALHNMEKRFSSFSSLNEVADSLEDSEEKSALLAEISDSGLEGWIEETTPGAVYDSLTEKIEELKETITNRTRFQELTSVQNALRLQRALYGSGSMQLPINLNDRVSNLHLYVVNKAVKDEMKIFMSLDTRSLGEVQAQIVTDGNSAALQLSAGTREELSALQEGAHRLEEYLEGVPVKIDEVRFIVREEGVQATPFNKNNEHGEKIGKTGRSLSILENNFSKDVKKLVSAIARMIEAQDNYKI